MAHHSLDYYVGLAKEGTSTSVDSMMKHLNKSVTIGESKLIDYALGLLTTQAGFDRMEHYLFHGTQMQRNYCALYFARRGEYLLLRKAYDAGLIDAIQAFSR